MIEFRHWLRRYSLSITLLALCAGSAAGQDYPTKPIRIIVPTQPGGTADLVSRVFAKGLGEKTKATVIVENKSGANGVIAANYVAKSEPDGYTIYLGFQGTQSVLQHIDPKLPSSKGLRPDRPSRFWSNSSRSQSVVCGKKRC